MSLGSNTLSITIDSNVTELVRVKQNDFHTQYRSRGNNPEYIVNVRHSTENPKADGAIFDRHNIELIENVLPTENTPGYSRKTYAVIRNQSGDSYAEVKDTSLGLAGLLTESNINDMLAWIG